MKRILLAGTMAFVMSNLFAQDMEKARLMLQLKKYDDAKKEIDGYLANEKNAKKSDGWYVKAQTYLGMSYDEKAKSLVANPLGEAISAFKKYVELDPATKMMKEENYPMVDYINQSLFSTAGGMFNAKKYQESLNGFKEALSFGDFAKSKKLMNPGLDTATVFYAAVASSELKNNDEAINFYKMLVDNNIREYAGSSLGFAYESIVEYYMNKQDDANFNKYLPIARSVVPKSAFLKDADLAYIMKVGDFDSKLKKLEAKIAEGTKDDRVYSLYTTEIFNYLNSSDSATPKPTNPELYEAKMADGATKALAAFPSKGNPMYYLAAHHYNKLIFSTDAMTALKKKKPAPADLKAQLAKQQSVYDNAVNQSMGYYEKARIAFESNTERNNEEKTNYKKTLQRLSDLYYEKTLQPAVKKNPAELKKYGKLLADVDALKNNVK